MGVPLLEGAPSLGHIMVFSDSTPQEHDETFDSGTSEEQHFVKKQKVEHGQERGLYLFHRNHDL